ncbi:MAG: HEAT repeat domain-containing protein [Elusimicrobiota bacterium]
MRAKLLLPVVLSVLFSPSVIYAQVLPGPADPGAALRDPRLKEKFRSAYSARYRSAPETTLKELATGSDPDAAALLALVMTSDPDMWMRKNAAEALGRRGKDPAADLSALRFLELGLKDKDGSVRFSAVMSVAGIIGSPSMRKYKSDFVDASVIPMAEKILAAALADPDRDVQSAAGSLSTDIKYWNMYDSSTSLLREANYKKKERRNNIISGCIYALAPLTVLVGGFLLLLGKGGLAYLLIKPSSSLAKALHNAMEVLRRAPAMALAPLFSGITIMAIAGWVVYSALHMEGLHPGMSGKEAQAQAISLMLRPRVILAYLAAGFTLLFLNSILIDALVHRTRGQAFGLLEGTRSALARVFSILLLSLLSFGGVYVIRILTEKLKLRLGRWMAELVEFAATFAESGIMLATDYALVVLMAEKTGLMEAFRRTKDLVRGGRGPALRSLISMTTIRYESAMAACMMPFLFCILLMPLGMAISPAENWLALKLGLSGVDDYLVYFGGGLISSVLAGGIFLALVQALDAILAVGIYFNDRGEALPEGDSNAQ